MADLGTAYVNIVPKAPNIQNNIQGLLGGSEASAGVQKAGSGLGSKLMTGLKVSAVAAAAGIGKMVMDAFKAGGALEQSFGGLDTIFGEASAQAKLFAEQAASAGISANTYAEQAVGMGAALKQAFAGDTQAAVEAANTAIMDMADNAAKMGTPIENLQSAYQGFAKQNYTMLDNLKLGYGGTKAEMERLLADAEKFSGVKYDISNLGDVYAAIHVIQGELGLTGVAAEEAKTTLQGTTGAMKASWENLMAAMTTGEGLEAAMANMGESVDNFLSVVYTMGGKVAEYMPTVIGKLASTAMEHAPELIASGIELIVKLAAGVIAGIPKLIAKLPEVFSKAKSTFASYDWKALGSDAMTSLANGLSAAKDAVIAKIKEIAQGAWAAFKRWILGQGGGGDNQSTNAAGNSASVYKGVTSPYASTPTATAESGGISRRELEDVLKDLVVNVDVILHGDSGKIFQVVKSTAVVQARATGTNPLAVGG